MTNQDLDIMFLTMLCFTYCRVHSDYTKLQNRQQGSDGNLRNFPCVSSAAASCLPPATGSCQTFGSVMSPYQPTSTDSPAFLQISVYCICRWTCIFGVCLYGKIKHVQRRAHKHTQGRSQWSKTAPACGGFFLVVCKKQVMKGKNTSNWVTQRRLRFLSDTWCFKGLRLFCLSFLSPDFVFGRTCSFWGPQRSRTSFKIRFLRPLRLSWKQTLKSGFSPVINKKQPSILVSNNCYIFMLPGCCLEN